jgi:hypothetical protein
MAEHSAGHVFFPHSRGEDELQTNPESSSLKPQEQRDSDELPSHSAFTNEPEPPRSAFANESEPAQTQDHADAMVDPQNAAVESQDRSASNTAAVKCDVKRRESNAVRGSWHPRCG